MKFSMVVIANAEFAEILNSVSIDLESHMNNQDVSDGFGHDFDEIIFGVVAVGDDARNEFFLKRSNKCGWYKCGKTGRRIKYLDIGVDFNPEILKGKNLVQIKNILIGVLFERVELWDIKSPPKFDHEKFTNFIKRIFS